VRAGHIAAVVALKDVITGETISDVKKSISLGAHGVPEPGDLAGVEPKTRSTGKRWAWRSDVSLQEESSSRRTDENRPDHHLGMGRAAPRDIVDQHEPSSASRPRGKPQGGYRSVQKAIGEEGKVREASRRGQYGHVWLKLEPQPGKGNDSSRHQGRRVPKESSRSEEGVDEHQRTASSPLPGGSTSRRR